MKMHARSARRRTLVVNLRVSYYEEYIGRAGDRSSRAEKTGSPFGNPFPLNDASDRGHVISLYKNYFDERVRSDATFREAVFKLKAKRLGCFCAPKSCHGDIIVYFLEGDDECACPGVWPSYLRPDDNFTRCSHCHYMARGV
jgi:hypothetical protein